MIIFRDESSLSSESLTRTIAKGTLLFPLRKSSVRQAFVNYFRSSHATCCIPACCTCVRIHVADRSTTSNNSAAVSLTSSYFPDEDTDARTDSSRTRTRDSRQSPDAVSDRVRTYRTRADENSMNDDTGSQPTP